MFGLGISELRFAAVLERSPSDTRSPSLYTRVIAEVNNPLPSWVIEALQLYAEFRAE